LGRRHQPKAGRLVGGFETENVPGRELERIGRKIPDENAMNGPAVDRIRRKLNIACVFGVRDGLFQPLLNLFRKGGPAGNLQTDERCF
jgi:hypothetical protein